MSRSFTLRLHVLRFPAERLRRLPPIALAGPSEPALSASLGRGPVTETTVTAKESISRSFTDTAAVLRFCLVATAREAVSDARPHTSTAEVTAPRVSSVRQEESVDDRPRRAPRDVLDVAARCEELLGALTASEDGLGSPTP